MPRPHPCRCAPVQMAHDAHESCKKQANCYMTSNVTINGRVALRSAKLGAIAAIIADALSLAQIFFLNCFLGCDRSF